MDTGIIVDAIQAFVAAYPSRNGFLPCWRKPLVGFAAAGDPLFAEMKNAVRSSHALPQDLLPGAETVVAYFLPFEKEIPRSNREGTHASRKWAAAYVATNQLIVDLNDHLAALLAQSGWRTSVLPPTHNFKPEELVSDWSHKHVAFIAGLGKFGRHQMLITERGCCGRFGSVVTDAVLWSTPRPAGEFCLHRAGRSCSVCVEKCVVAALGEDKFDRHRCYAVLLENVALHHREGYADVCGKCTCVVPCSFVNPVAARRHLDPE